MLREIALPTVKPGFKRVIAALNRVIAGYETGWAGDRPSSARSAARFIGADYTAAYAYAYTADDFDLKTKHSVYRRMADKLCDLLAEAPIGDLEAAI